MSGNRMGAGDPPFPDLTRHGRCLPVVAPRAEPCTPAVVDMMQEIDIDLSDRLIEGSVRTARRKSRR
jgi:hypothetical protein